MQLQPEDIFALRTLLREELSMAFNRPAEVPMLPGLAGVPAEKFCPDLNALEAATGITRDLLRAVKKASVGQPDSPFRGHGAFPGDVRRWLDARPAFRAPTRPNGRDYAAQRYL